MVILWIRRVLGEVVIKHQAADRYEDNSGTLKRSSGHISGDVRRRKHVYIRHHYLSEQVRNKNVFQTKFSASEIISYFITNPLQGKVISNSVRKLQMVRLNA